MPDGAHHTSFQTLKVNRRATQKNNAFLTPAWQPRAASLTEQMWLLL